MVKQFYTSVRAAFKSVPVPFIHIYHPASFSIYRYYTAPHYFIADICHPFPVMLVLGLGLGPWLSLRTKVKSLALDTFCKSLALALRLESLALTLRLESLALAL